MKSIERGSRLANRQARRLEGRRSRSHTGMDGTPPLQKEKNERIKSAVDRLHQREPAQAEESFKNIISEITNKPQVKVVKDYKEVLSLKDYRALLSNDKTEAERFRSFETLLLGDAAKILKPKRKASKLLASSSTNIEPVDIRDFSAFKNMTEVFKAREPEKFMKKLIGMFYKTYEPNMFLKIFDTAIKARPRYRKLKLQMHILREVINDQKALLVSGKLGLPLGCRLRRAFPVLFLTRNLDGIRDTLSVKEAHERAGQLVDALTEILGDRAAFLGMKPYSNGIETYFG